MAGPGLRRQPRHRRRARSTPCRPAPDGSVYMLADVTKSVEGQAIQGTQDVALLKYDSAGHLIYTRTPGATEQRVGPGARGLVDRPGGGRRLGHRRAEWRDRTARSIPTRPAKADQTDSFVTLYDASGNEIWTERRGATLQDQASQVAFSADGKTVYVAGQAQGSMPGSAVGPQAATTAISRPSRPRRPARRTPPSPSPSARAGQDTPKGMVVDGNTLFTASVESGHAVLRNYDISSGTPVLSNTRDLGDLQGGSISRPGAERRPARGGRHDHQSGALAPGRSRWRRRAATDAFAAQVDESLNPTAGDAIAYYGGAGNDRATALAVSNGQVWIGGQAGTDLPGQAPVGTQGRLHRPAGYRHGRDRHFAAVHRQGRHGRADRHRRRHHRRQHPGPPGPAEGQDRRSTPRSS